MLPCRARLSEPARLGLCGCRRFLPLPSHQRTCRDARGRSCRRAGAQLRWRVAGLVLLSQPAVVPVPLVRLVLLLLAVTASSPLIVPVLFGITSSPGAGWRRRTGEPAGECSGPWDSS